MRRRRLTIADVARRAGVSVGTVSNVMNGTAAVRPQTRERVEAAMRELGYPVDGYARSMISRAHRARNGPADPERPRLVTVGYTSVDYTARVEVLPHRDDRITATAIEKSLGGPAANVAVVAAGLADRFPVAVELVTAIGDDADSEWALIELARRRVDTIAIRRQPGQRLSRCIILVERNGSRTIVNEPFELQESDLARYLGDGGAQAARCLHIEGYQVPRMLDSVRTMRRSGWLTSLQTTGLPATWRRTVPLCWLFAGFDVVFLNREVAREATDCRGGMKQLIEATQGLVESVADRGTVVLTLGEDGALVFPPGAAPIVQAAPLVPVVDTTGAGDAFAGAFLAAWLHTRDAAVAARYGVAAGSLLVSVTGAQGAAPTAADLERLLEPEAEPAKTLTGAS
jgi:ribokinase